MCEWPEQHPRLTIDLRSLTSWSSWVGRCPVRQRCDSATMAAATYACGLGGIELRAPNVVLGRGEGAGSTGIHTASDPHDCPQDVI